MLLREAQLDVGHPLRACRFAVLVGGFVPRDTDIAGRLRGAPLCLQSLHVSGANDLLVPRPRSEALAELCPKAW